MSENVVKPLEQTHPLGPRTAYLQVPTTIGETMLELRKPALARQELRSAMGARPTAITPAPLQCPLCRLVPGFHPKAFVSGKAAFCRYPGGRKQGPRRRHRAHAAVLDAGAGDVDSRLARAWVSGRLL